MIEDTDVRRATICGATGRCITASTVDAMAAVTARSAGGGTGCVAGAVICCWKPLTNASVTASRALSRSALVVCGPGVRSPTSAATRVDSKATSVPETG